jgi:UDP-N-acetylmuramoylalanine--D-glutamate ligase
MGGNIGTGRPLAGAAGRRAASMSSNARSFQIDLAPSLAPTIGIQMNLTPDHLDRHGTLENYAAIKERLVAKSISAVIGDR